MKDYWLLFLVATLTVAATESARSQSLYQAEPAVIASFGGAVAVGEHNLFVAEPSGFKYPGRVHIYRRDAEGRWEMIASLSASDGDVGDGFGGMLAVSGDALLVGASQGGAVYVFERDAASDQWAEKHRLTAADAQGGDRFGSSMALHGDMALIGASGPADNLGAVYVFRRDAQTGEWTESAKISGDEELQGFGSAIAMDDARVLVGASGAVLVYSIKQPSGVLEQEAQLSGEDAGVTRSFGSALHLFGAEVLIGAPLDNQALGSVQVFRYDDVERAWAHTGALEPDSMDVRALFGMAVQATAEAIWVGAPGAQSSAGRLYRYGRDDATGLWGEAEPWANENARSRDRYASAFAIAGRTALVAAPGTAYGEGSAVLMERSSEQEPWEKGDILFRASEAMDPILGRQIDCADGAADAFACGEVDLVSFVPLADLGAERGVRLSDVWGWTDPQTGREYGLIGHLEGTVFVDLSDPSNPVYLGDLPRTQGSPGSTWRDIKVYRDHAFIVADGAGEHGMQVFDLAQLREAGPDPVAFEESAHYGQIHSAHNIVINEETGFAFAVGASGGGQTCGGGLHMIDISDPVAPTFAGCFADPATGRRQTGYSHDAQCVVYHGPDMEHQGKEICVGANETAISISDVTDKEHPISVGSGLYPDVGYVHQGWLSDDHAYFFQNDELDELSAKVDRTRTLVWDVRDLDDPVMVKEYFGPTSATDHNLYVRDNLMYQTNNASGLRILDITDPEDPVEVGFFDTTPYGADDAGFNGTWSSYPYFDSGIIVVTSRREGLFILKKHSVDT